MILRNTSQDCRRLQYTNDWLIVIYTHLAPWFKVDIYGCGRCLTLRLLNLRVASESITLETVHAIYLLLLISGICTCASSASSATLFKECDVSIRADCTSYVYRQHRRTRHTILYYTHASHSLSVHTNLLLAVHQCEW